MVANYMKRWSRHNIFKKGDNRVEIVRMCIVWGLVEKDVSWLYWYLRII